MSRVSELNVQIDFLDAIARNAEAAAEAAREKIAEYEEQLAYLQPFPGVYMHVRSKSRPNITHLIVAQPDNLDSTRGYVRCSCESALFRSQDGPCLHVREQLENGTIDARAEWNGGLFGQSGVLNIKHVYPIERMAAGDVLAGSDALLDLLVDIS